MKFRPIISSQNYRAGLAIRSALSAQLGISVEDLFPLYSVRLSQTGVVTYFELPNARADIVFYSRDLQGGFSAEPALIVFLDQENSENSATHNYLKKRGVSYVFTTARRALSDAESLIPASSARQFPRHGNKPFRHNESKYLLGLLQAIHAKGMSDSVLITGQVSLKSFTSFEGYSHHSSRPDSDADLLICTPPPICFPVMAIEVDGPPHYSLEVIEEECGDAQTAKAKLAEQAIKTAEKDSAYEASKIAVVHVRVNAKVPSVRDTTMVYVCNAILGCVNDLFNSGEVLEKKAAWIASINETLEKKILAPDRGQRYFSKNPELEDAFFTLRELYEASRRELGMWRKQYMKSFWAKMRSDGEKNTETKSTVRGLYRDWEILESIRADGWEGVVRHLYFFEGGRIEADGGATVQQEFIISLILGSGSPFNVLSFSERIPYIDLAGYFPGDAQAVFIGYVIAEMRENLFRRLTLAQREELLKNAKEILEIDEYMLQQRVATKEIAATIDKHGPKALSNEFQSRAIRTVRSLLQASGVIGLQEGRTGKIESSPGWIWTYSESQCPYWWDEKIQTIESLDVAVAAVQELTYELRERILSYVNAWGSRQIEFLEAANVSFEIVAECTSVLDSIQRRIRK